MLFSMIIVAGLILMALWKVRWSPDARRSRYKRARTRIGQRLNAAGRHKEALYVLLHDQYPEDITPPRIGL